MFRRASFICFLIGAISRLGLAEPRFDNSLRLKIVQSSSSTVTVEVRNVSDKPVRIWNKSNSWGAAPWRLVILRGGQTLTLFQNPDQYFTKNNPTYHEIAANGTMNEKLDLNDGSWLGAVSEKMNFSKGDTVVVLYDVPSSREAHELGVWYGVAAAHSVID